MSVRVETGDGRRDLRGGDRRRVGGRAGAGFGARPGQAGGTGLGGTGLGGTGLGGTGLSGTGLGGAGLGGATQTLVSSTGTAVEATLAAWVLGSAQGVLDDTATALGETTAPQLRTTWFSSTYWRMAAIASVLTLPFLFAAAVQAVIRSDLALLARATFGFLPLAMLGIAIAAPLTMLLLAASDQMSGFISSAAGNASAHFLAKAGAVIGAPGRRRRLAVPRLPGRAVHDRRCVRAVDRAADA